MSGFILSYEVVAALVDNDMHCIKSSYFTFLKEQVCTNNQNINIEHRTTVSAK